MQQRALGSAGPSIFPVGFGCMGLKSSYTETTDADAARALGRALELGVVHFDTADVYDLGANEELVGQALRNHRDRVVLASKFGQLVEDGKRLVRCDPDYVKAACEASLKRLGVETIDLYYAHRIDPTVPVEETVGAMSELVVEGKVRWLGVSEASPESTRRAHAVHPLAAIQNEYSLWTRFAESEHFDLCRDLGITFVAYAPLGRGFLSGAIKSADDLRPGDWRHAHPRFQPESIAANLARLEVLRDIAVEQGVSAAQIALAWVLSSEPFIHTIPGTTSVAHLEENVSAAELRLTDDQVARLSNSFETVVGERYPAPAMTKLQR